jgi:hypothetical protein
MFLVGKTLHAHLRSAQLSRDALQPVALAQGQDVSLEEVDAVFVRKDPRLGLR